MPQLLANTIIPVFSIILLGYIFKRKGLILPPYSRTANQIVFYVAMPAMLFNALAKAPFREFFHLGAGLCLLTTLGLVGGMALLVAILFHVDRSSRGTFIQTSFHGNLGYMAYAIAFYALGTSDFARTAILSSFLIIGQNMLGILSLSAFRARSPGARPSLMEIARGTLQNPVIVAVTAGSIVSALAIPVPSTIKQGLDILAGMALPTALLLIGASLSFKSLHTMARELAGIGILKLACMPLIGYLLMKWASVPDSLILPGAILLASPPATVTYVMAAELGGDTELAASSISVLTLLSACSYSLILWLLL
ncbi:MAG: AEC family transporter [Syntrophobacteraceae bacterium]|nr:AEC family transporter [Syntrophobacteraceae bacterium]